MEKTAVEFFSWLFSYCELGHINLRFLGGKFPQNEFIPLSAVNDDPSLIDAILRDHCGLDSYFAVALRAGSDGKKEAIIQIPGLWVDLDGAPLNPVLEGPFPPSAVVETRPERFHSYWKLREPADRSEIPQVEKLLKRLASYFTADMNATDASRILRIPGTQNFKTNPSFPVTAKFMNGQEYDLSDFINSDLPQLQEPEPAIKSSGNGAGERIKKILDCKFLQHCDKERATLPEPQWYAMISVFARESGGRELIHSLSRGYPKYSPRETDDKILHALGTGPRTCQEIKNLWNCDQDCGVKSPAALLFKKEILSVPKATKETFPREAIGGVAGEFADLYSHYLESPWTFFAFNYLTCLGHVLADRVTLASEITPQPRFYNITLGESADDRKSEAQKQTVKFFEGALTPGNFKVCQGVGSTEGLARILSEEQGGTKKLLLVYDELKAFVGKASIEGSTLLPAVSTFFESNKFHTATKKETIKFDGVYLSLMGASTLGTFENMWTPQFMDIGLLNRFWLVKDSGKRKFSIPKEIPWGDIKRLRQHLGNILGSISCQDAPVKLTLSPEAFEIFDQWYLNQAPSIFSRRLDTYGHRLLILLTVNEERQEVTPEIAEKVVSLLRWQHDLRRECDPVEAEGNIAKMEETIRRRLTGGALEQRDLQRRVHYNRYGLYVWRTSIDNLLRANEVFFDRKAKVYGLAK